MARGVPLPRSLTAIFAIAIGLMAGYYFWLVRQPAAQRPGWTRSDVAHVSAVSCGTLGVALSCWAIALGAHAMGQPLGFELPLLASGFGLAVVAFLHDVWAGSE